MTIFLLCWWWAVSLIIAFAAGVYLARKDIAENIFGISLIDFANRFERGK